MNTTYKKKLKTITVFVNGMQQPFTFTDTVDEPTATRILYEFQHNGGANGVIQDMQGWIPTSSVSYVLVTEAESDVISKNDVFCVEPASDELVIKICSEGEAPNIYCADSPQKPITKSDFEALLIAAGCSTPDCLDSTIFVYWNDEQLHFDSTNQDWRDSAQQYSYHYDNGEEKMVFSRLTQ